MIREIQAMDDELFVYAHFENAWLEVSVSKFEFYMHNEEFKKTCVKWRTILNKMRLKVVFVCGWLPKEEVLVQLAEQNNLII